MKQHEFEDMSAQVQRVLKIIMPHFAEKILHEYFISLSEELQNTQPQF
jgi:hypothetical protein